MRFSQRQGFNEYKLEIQIDSMTDALRNRLWNVVHESFIYDDRDRDHSWSWRLKNLAEFAEKEFFKYRVDGLPGWGRDYVDTIRVRFYEMKFYEVYDYLEWLAEFDSKNVKHVAVFVRDVNRVLAEELAGYRFVGFQLAPITNTEELEAVSQAAKSDNQYDAVGNHIRRAISLFSDRANPDYRNSVKESISAVECAARIITDNPKATLGEALKLIEQDKLHPALRDGFLKIYGYTSDAHGIWHALMEAENLTQADARLMLVSFSAFSSYLIEKAKAENIP